MSLLSATQLAAFRTRAASVLDLSGAQVQRNTSTRNARGAQTDSWANVGSSVSAGMAKPSAAIQREFAHLIGEAQAWVVRLPYGTDVKGGDRLLIAGLTLKVQALLTPESYPTLTSVLAAEVR